MTSNITKFFMASDHDGDSISRRSQTGILLYCNFFPIICYSKPQNTIESSAFGAECVALGISSELIISMRYKLRVFGMPLGGSVNVLL